MGINKKKRKAKQSKSTQKSGLRSKIASGSKSILRVFANLDYPGTGNDGSNSAGHSDASAPASPPWIHFT